VRKNVQCWRLCKAPAKKLVQKCFKQEKAKLGLKELKQARKSGLSKQQSIEIKKKLKYNQAMVRTMRHACAMKYTKCKKCGTRAMGDLACSEIAMTF